MENRHYTLTLGRRKRLYAYSSCATAKVSQIFKWIQMMCFGMDLITMLDFSSE